MFASAFYSEVYYRLVCTVSSGILLRESESESELVMILRALVRYIAIHTDFYHVIHKSRFLLFLNTDSPWHPKKKFNLAVLIKDLWDDYWGISFSPS